jgi:hypothetical protein
VGLSLFVLPAAALGQGWYDSNWGYRKKITIDNTMVAGDLTNFPVLLNFTDTDLRDKARNDGWDIDHDFEDYNGATGAIIVWVEVTNLSGSVDTDIYMYYGYPTVPSNQENESGTWSDNYEAVYHLHNNSFADATGNHDGSNLLSRETTPSRVGSGPWARTAAATYGAWKTGVGATTQRFALRSATPTRTVKPTATTSR